MNQTQTPADRAAYDVAANAALAALAAADAAALALDAADVAYDAARGTYDAARRAYDAAAIAAQNAAAAVTRHREGCSCGDWACDFFAASQRATDQ